MWLAVMRVLLVAMRRLMSLLLEQLLLQISELALQRSQFLVDFLRSKHRNSLAGVCACEDDFLGLVFLGKLARRALLLQSLCRNSGECLCVESIVQLPLEV